MADDQDFPPAATGHLEREPVPKWLVGVDICYVIALGGLALWWGQSQALRNQFPWASTGVPVEVLWWGALGAVTVSLAATTKFRDDWDNSLNPWHLARPVLGAVLGAVSYLIFVVVIAAAGATRSDRSNGHLTFIWWHFSSATGKKRFVS